MPGLVPGMHRFCFCGAPRTGAPFGALTFRGHPRRIASSPPRAARRRLDPMTRKIATAWTVLLAVAAFAAPGSARADDYPSRLIKMMHGFPPGGNVDIIARLLGHEMQKSLGRTIVIEAKPGQAGSLAAEAVAHADPDGYTLLVLPSAHPAAGALYKNLKYRVVEDFAWISTVSFYPFVVCVRKDSRFHTLGDLLKEARARPGGLSYGSAGVGSILHTTVELMANLTQTKFVHVPYRGEAPALTGLLGGDFDFIAATTGPTTERIKNGDIRALAVTSKARWKTLPDVPTVAEAGIPGFEVISWTGVATTAGVPQPILDRLHAEVHRAIAVPEVRSKLEAMGGDVRAMTPAQMRELVAGQLALWTRVVREQKIQVP
jgi:tripartite-type tricarboxylate transporter receptor subunit TctC